MTQEKRGTQFYDIEVFSRDSLVVFRDGETGKTEHFWSVREPDSRENGFEPITERIRGKTLAGYNNYHYDDLILYAMICGAPQTRIREISDDILRGENMKVFSNIASRHFDALSVTTLDCMQQIDVSCPSLKKIEGNMGRSIVESPIPFDIDRPLTDGEREEVLRYCSYDAESTEKIYDLRRESYFDVKESLISMEGTNRCRKWNTTTISANILLNRSQKPWMTLRVPERLWRNVPAIPDEVWKMWEDHSWYGCGDGKGKSVTVRKFGCDMTFGLGGLHGANSTKNVFGHVILLDVASMYPSIIIGLNALGKGTEKYRKIRDERVQLKRTDPARAKAMKLVLNSVYGSMKNTYSGLYNPMAASTVCIYGQIALADLCGRLYDAGYMIVNVNTDGVAFTDVSGAGEDYRFLWMEWEDDYGLSLEKEEFDSWIQKDVNNYIARQGDRIKTKGGDCCRYQSDSFFSCNDARIVQMALVDRILFGKDPVRTITENLDRPILYQYVLKAGGSFLGTCDGSGVLRQKVNRVFAAAEGADGITKLYKLRPDGSKVNFPGAPERMVVYNGDLNGYTDLRSIADIDHYYQVVSRELEGWSQIA